MKVAAIQMVSGISLDANLSAARALLDQAARAADPTAAREAARRIAEALEGRTLPDSAPMVRAERDA